jgi:hypothetical protein
MPAMSLLFDGDGVLAGIDRDKLIHITEPIEVAALHHGMESGRPSVAFLIPLPDGRTVVAETSMQLFHAAARGFAARFGWQDRPDPPPA